MKKRWQKNPSSNIILGFESVLWKDINLLERDYKRLVPDIEQHTIRITYWKLSYCVVAEFHALVLWNGPSRLVVRADAEQLLAEYKCEVEL